MKKVVLLESLGISAEELASFKKPFAGEVEFVDYAKTTDIPTLIDEAKDADAMIIANMPMPNEVIAACDKLQFIDVAFTGVDHVGLDAAKAKGVKVSNASGYSNEAVSELVIGMALSVLRNIPQTQERVRAGGTKDGLVGCELKGKTVGIIGYGKIGSRTGELLHAFNCHVLAQSRKFHPEYPDYVEQVSQEEQCRPRPGHQRGRSRPRALRGRHRRCCGGRVHQGAAPASRHADAPRAQHPAHPAHCLCQQGIHDPARRDRV